MAVKQIVSLTTVPGGNEQSSAAPITVTATGNSRTYYELGNFNRAIFFLDVGAASGTTPTLDVVIQVQDPVSLEWSTEVTFPQQTAATGATPLTPIKLELYGFAYRAVWTVTGSTPSFTFSCCAVAGTEEPITI